MDVRAEWNMANPWHLIDCTCAAALHGKHFFVLSHCLIGVVMLFLLRRECNKVLAKEVVEVLHSPKSSYKHPLTRFWNTVTDLWPDGLSLDVECI